MSTTGTVKLSPYEVFVLALEAIVRLEFRAALHPSSRLWHVIGPKTLQEGS
jgi:hypothetical protein